MDYKNLVWRKFIQFFLSTPASILVYCFHKGPEAYPLPPPEMLILKYIHPLFQGAAEQDKEDGGLH